MGILFLKKGGMKGFQKNNFCCKYIAYCICIIRVPVPCGLLTSFTIAILRWFFTSHFVTGCNNRVIVDIVNTKSQRRRLYRLVACCVVEDKIVFGHGFGQLIGHQEADRARVADGSK